MVTMIYVNQQHRRKERVRSELLPCPSSVLHNAAHVVQSTTAHASLDVNNCEESISYTVGRSKFNPCYHTKFQTYYLGNLSDGIGLSNTNGTHYHNYYGHHGHGNGAHQAAEVQFTNALSAVSPLDHRALADEAMRAMKPDLTGVDIPVFLVELRDLRRMFQFWRADSSINRNLSGLHLNWNFGWKPFIGDLQKLWNTLNSVQQAVEDWNNRTGKPLVRHYSFPIERQSFGGTFNYGGNSTRPCTWTATWSRAVTAHAKYLPLPFRVAPGLGRDIRGFMQGLGVGLRPSVAWELLPFSFVVDWFFNVGRWIQILDLDTLELPFQLMDFCLQSKVRSTLVSNLRLFVGEPQWSQVVGCPGWATTRNYFSRTVGAPDPSDLFAQGWKLPNLRQTLLGVSLVNVLRR